MLANRAIAAALVCVLVTACGGERAADEVVVTSGSDETVAGDKSLPAIIASEHRSADDRARDPYRHPLETLEFFGIDAEMTVVAVWPGAGWYTEIIAPFLAAGGGTYIAAGFDPNLSGEAGQPIIREFNDRYTNSPGFYGDVKVTALSAESDGVAPAGSADMVLTFRNVHNWLYGGFADKAFADFYAALKPGGILGVVEHRLPASAEQNARASSGYVHEATVRRLAEAAGFEFVASSEINANPADTADHPFGVWTLLPERRSSDGGTAPADFDREAFDAIGESDRMTLKFRKPITADGALLE